jgi:hypothetical protein
VATTATIEKTVSKHLHPTNIASFAVPDKDAKTLAIIFCGYLEIQLSGLSCPHHPAYKAERMPRKKSCEDCMYMYAMAQLVKMTKKEFDL